MVSTDRIAKAKVQAMMLKNGPVSRESLKTSVKFLVPTNTRQPGVSCDPSLATKAPTDSSVW